MRRGGFNIVELITTIAIIMLLAAVILPSLSAARDMARMSQCAAQMHHISVGLHSYAAENKRQFPPFAFSDIQQPDLALSGHWGGVDDDAKDWASNMQRSGGMGNVNLGVLRAQQLVSESSLVCPQAHDELVGGQASWFGNTPKFSTYCLRMPPSAELFGTSGMLANRGGGLMGIYRQYAGGRRVAINQPGYPVGVGTYTVPLVRQDMRYRLAGAAGEVGDGVFDPSVDSVLSDAWWTPPGTDGAYAVRRSVSHGSRFNVLSGDGAVAARMQSADTGDIKPTADDAEGFAGIEAVWQGFDAAR